MNKLAFEMTDAIKAFERKWSTLDKNRIRTMIRFCLTRELTRVEERKDAIEFAKNRQLEFDEMDDALDMSQLKSLATSSPSRAGSPSPKKMPQTTIRDVNTTGFDLKSLGATSRNAGPMLAGRPGGLEPPTLKLNKINMTGIKTDAKGKPLEDMKRQGTTVSEKTGARSARSARSGISRTSRGEPVDPYKDLTVEQMDEKISRVAAEIHKL